MEKKSFESDYPKEFSFSTVCKKSTMNLWGRKCFTNTEKNCIENLLLDLNEFAFQGWF